MSNSPKMECLENYIKKFNVICSKENIINFFLLKTSILKFKDELKNEILENHIVLGDNFNKYLEFVNHRIKNETNYFLDPVIIEDLSKRYDFSFDTSKEPENALKDFGLHLNLKEFANIPIDEKQKDYDTYEFHLSSIEIFTFVNSFLNVDCSIDAQIIRNPNASVESPESNIEEPKDKNDFTKSTIEDFLADLIDDINKDDYKILLDSLYSYFTTGTFPLLDSKINFKRVNKKKIGWALKALYKSLKMDTLDIEYFRFAQENINLFSKEIIENDNFKKSKFYKMFTTNPAK